MILQRGSEGLKAGGSVGAGLRPGYGPVRPEPLVQAKRTDSGRQTADCLADGRSEMGPDGRFGR